jgi:uncharacterized repeat protein (TIGR01451 family)
MSRRKNSVSCHWILDSLEFTLIYRVLTQSVRLAGAASLFVGMAAGGAPAAQTKAATVTSLSIKANGSEVSSVAAGTVTTLTAQVTTAGANVSPGQVNFCDATVAYCTDVHILATAQLTSSGTATYKFRPGIGSHSYKAVFIGTQSYAGSISTASPLSVTGTAGPFSTATSIAETGAWGNYTLTGTVTEAGGTTAPIGTLSFLDASNGNSVIGGGSLGAATAGVGWPNPGSLTKTQGTYFVLAADLNGDGIPDLVLGSNVVTIYLGKTDGTYTKKVTISVQQAPTSYPIVIADFNDDGIPDLAVPLYGSNEIAILLGSGDGTFAHPVMASLPDSIVSITQMVAGDFNGDGISDLAVIDSDNSKVDILSGKGDGTFTAEATNPPISGFPTYFATGDFNGDGKADLAVGKTDGTIAILSGNGDGTFAALGSVNSGSSGAPIAAADFNGDGKLDIAVAAGSGASEAVIVLTGNGDGTFSSPFSGGAPTSTSVTWIQVADFNQDGAPDVILADSAGSATVFLNNGGSVSESFPLVLGLRVPYYLEVGVGDLNGDGYPDIVAGGYYDSALGLYLTEPTETASASAAIQVNSVGQHLAQASFPAEGNYESSVSNSIRLWGLLPATSTTLSVTSGGSSVTKVTPGTAVLLAAQVHVGATPVTAGQVNFCDASGPHCTDIKVLGSAALDSSGTATFTFVPGPGAHSYQAQFVEDGFGLASASNVAPLTVGPAPAPTYSDTAAITIVNGSPGDYSLTATVTGYGGPASPTGKVSFIDTSFGNNVLATASLGAGIPGIGFLESLSPAFGSTPFREVTADFNGDGIPDLATISTDNGGSPYTVAVFLGNGDGTFRTGPISQPSTPWSYPFMISGDFNGDGEPDLAILSYDGSTTSYITILLNNGDGSFTSKPTVVAYKQGSTGGDVILGTMTAADFNGDGKLDLAIVGDYVSAGGVTILLGNGDGTFAAAGPNLDPTADFALIATGDFNGDGIPDFVVPNYFEFGGSPTIFLGKGDGTFTYKRVSFTLDYFPTSVVVGDFNGDGILDLAFSDLNGVEIALGNGDGTFNETAASPIQVPSELYSLQIGDFNHDGKPDLAGWDTYFGQIVLLLGAGDGTFAATIATPGVNSSTFDIHQMAAADFNGDGVPDLALLTYRVNAASILLTVPTETATATVNGIAPVGAGTHNVDASYTGDSHYGAVTTSTISLIAGQSASVAVSQTGSSANAVAGTDFTYTINLTNNGPDNATTLVVKDVLPSGVSLVSTSIACSSAAATLTCPVGNLAAGASTSFNVTVFLPAGGAGASTIKNTVSITLDEVDKAKTTSSLIVPVVFVADLAITKSESPSPAVAGTYITYTISVRNAGPSNAASTVVTDTLPAGVNFVSSSSYACSGTTVLTCGLGTVGSGTSTNFTVKVAVPANYLSKTGATTGTITNTATVASPAADPSLDNNTASVSTMVIAVADLAITKTESPDPAPAGTNIKYTIGVSNAGPSDATITVVTDTLPAGLSFVSSTLYPCSGATVVTCNLGTVANGGHTSFVITAHIPANYLSSLNVLTANITNTASVTFSGTDPNRANNTASSSNAVISVAHLKVSATTAPNPVHEGAALVYSVSFVNDGPSDAQNGSIQQTIPAAFRLTGYTDEACGEGTGHTVCRIGVDVPAGFNLTFQMTYKIPATFLGTESSKNVKSTLQIRSQSIEPDPGSFSVTTKVIP